MIIELAEKIAESEKKIMDHAISKTKEDLEKIEKASADAAEKLKIEIGNVKSDGEGKSKLEKIVAELETVTETVKTEKEERIKNTKAISVLKADAKVAKEMILLVKSDLEAHKESSQKNMLEEVKMMVEESQLVTIEKTKEITVKEMSVEIKKVKTSVSSKMKQALTVIEEGQKAEKAEHEASQKKLQDALEGLSKKVDLNVETTEKIKKDKEGISSSVKALQEMVKASKAKHEKSDQEVAAIRAYIEKIQSKIKENEETMPSKSDLGELEDALSKVKSQAVIAEENIETETIQREEALRALETEVTANEEHLDDLEEELLSVQEDIISVAGIMQELQEEQDEVADEAVKKALASVQTMVTETTEKVMADEVEQIRSETKAMTAQVEQTVVTLQGKIEAEKKTRAKSDDQITKLQQTVEKLEIALEEKADTETVEKISKELSTIQSTVVKEQVARKDSEKQMTTIKSAMSILFTRTSRKEKEVKIVREVQETTHIKKRYEKESTTKIQAQIAKVSKLEQKTHAEIGVLRADISSVQEKLVAESESRRKSDMLLLVLKDRTQAVYKKLSQNSDKIAGLETKINHRLSTLSKSLTELSAKVLVSGDSSKGDLTRMDTMLQSLVEDLQKEVAARTKGDTTAQTEMLSRIETLLTNVISEEMTTSEISKVVTQHTSKKTEITSKTETIEGDANMEELMKSLQ
jgi:chromosome segregation ATPase